MAICISKRVFILGLISILWASGAAAHEEAAEPSSQPPSDEVSSSPASDEVASSSPQFTTVVRGTRTPHSASEFTVTSDVIRAAPRSGATDLLRLVPGLVASQHSGEGKAQQLFLRGFDAVHGQDVELNVAGIPVNEVSHIHALGYADLNWLIPAAVREVTVTEGSSRANQGDFAVAGTVRYDLGLADPGVSVAGSYGSFNRRRLFAGVRPQSSPETFAAIEYIQSDGFGPQRAFGRLSFLSQLALDIGEFRFHAVAASMGSRFDSPGVVRQDAYLAGTAGFFDAFGLRQGGSTSRHQLLLAIELPPSLGRIKFEAFGVLSDLRIRNNFTGFFANAEGDGLEQSNNDIFVGFRALHHHHFTIAGQRLNLELGLGGRHDRISQGQRAYRESDGTPFREDVDARIAQNTANAFFELSWLPQTWRFMVGGRVDALHYEVLDLLAFDNPRFFAGRGATRSAFGAHWGLKAGVEKRLGDSFKLHLNYGDGFRSPQARSLGDGERAPFVSVRSAEVGASFEHPTVSARLVGFGSYVDNDFFFDQTIGTTTYTGATLRGGIQGQVTARPVPDWLVSLNATYAAAKIVKTGALLPYFAPIVVRLDTSYSYPFTLFGHSWIPSVGLGFTVIGSRPLPFDQFSYTVALLDARLGLRVKFVELTLDVQNLLGSRWRDGEFVYTSRWNKAQAASLIPARQFSAGYPRTVLLTLEVHI